MVEAAVSAPTFESADAASFGLATWQVGIGTEFGVTPSLTLGGRFSYSQVGGVIDEYSEQVEGREVRGRGAFDGAFYSTELLMRYLVYGGYDTAPYLELGGGYLFGQYRNIDILDAQDRILARDVGDEGRGAFTASAGLYVDMRLVNTMTVGVGARYQHVFDDLYRWAVIFPVRFSYYWFR